VLKSIQKPSHLKQFKGQTIGIDAYGWLHRGCTACAVDLALGNPTMKYVEFAMGRVQMLLTFGITPYLVFDGANLPSKAGTDDSRNASRSESRAQGLELLRRGRTDLAHQMMQKAVDVTPEMAGMLIRELKRAGVKFVVAPYEADAQLTYLEQKGLINGILSEDSDLLVFGAKYLLTKLDKYGNCVMIRRQDFTACREMSLVGWSDQDFRCMSILSGCDYLDSIEGIGLKTAYRLLRKHKKVERVLQAVRLEGKKKVPSDYLQQFVQAEMTFLYQWVYCPLSHSMVNVTKPDSSVNVLEMAFIGTFIEADIARGVAMGELHPSTKKPLLPLYTTQPRNRLNPNNNISRNQENIQPPKKGVSIADFFKAKRVPLAELDPNSFIMTPNQQTLARDASNRSWSSPIVPPSAVVETRTVPNFAPVSRPPLRTVSIGTPSVKKSERVRLFQDDKENSGSVLETTSKFFSASSKKKRKRQASDFEIHSDDSVEDVFEALAKESPLHLHPSKVSRSSDNKSPLAVSPQDDEDETQLTLVDIEEPFKPPHLLGGDDEETFVEDSATDSGIFDSYLHGHLDAIRKKCEPITSPTLSTKIQNPLHNSKSSTTPFVIPASPTHKAPLVELDIPDSAWAEINDAVAVPASSIAIPASPLKANKTSSMIVQGSEDLLVSDSEGECEDESRPVRTLNLSRFAYTSSR
jgi:exonuclease-1